VSKARTTEKTDFSELNATARIAGGVATSDDLDVKSPYLRIGGAGRFDIGRSLIDYTAKATVIGSPAGQDGADLAALKGVSVPVHLSGPFDAMDWKIQWSGVVAAAAQNKLKDKLAERLGIKPAAPAAGTDAASAPQSSKEKLRDKLKGLLK
jgi:AsmA protein